MKRLLYSQRVEVIAGYNERRDCADQQIARFIWACGFLSVPVNNLPEQTPDYIEQYVAELQPAGIVLTGGNDLTAYGGNAPERDETERRLVETALRDNIPLLGFCRGMQLLAWHLGGRLVPVEGHVAVRHRLLGECSELVGREVNSYHNYAVAEAPAGFDVLARAEDGVIEAIRHRERRLLGIMWHPEREAEFRQADMAMFREFFK